jgi:hypothetical protein
VAEMREIIIEAGGNQARARLTSDLSPKAADALWASLPIETTLVPVKWSGRAGFFFHEAPAMQAVTELEYPVCSIYPGYLVMRPGGSELLLSYGFSEYRWASGTDYVTPVAHVIDGFKDLVATLGRMHDEGATSILLRQAD